jgi:hypothetical protein
MASDSANVPGMSTPPRLRGVKAERPAERVLFRALFDDAAVFPPQLAPLPQAVAEQVARQSTSYADLVGPLLLPVSAVEDLLHLEGLAHLEGSRLKVALIGRVGTSPTLVEAALSSLDEHATVTVTGVELVWSPDWQVQGADWQVQGAGSRGRGVLGSIEVPRGGNLERALSEIQAHATGGNRAQAKFRTGSTSEQPAPTPTELATFIRSCVDHDLSFKLTGGLHHALSGTTSQGERQVGFLNVIAATRWALSHGAEVPEMEALISQRDPVPILDIITRMSEADAAVLRAFFASYGCCGVMDPVGELVALALIKETDS